MEEISKQNMSNLLLNSPITLTKKYTDQQEYHNKKTDSIVSMTELRLGRFLTKEEEDVVRMAIMLERMCGFNEKITDEEKEKYYFNFGWERETHTKEELEQLFSLPPFISLGYY